MNTHRRLVTDLALIFLVSLAFGAARGDELNFGLRAGANYSDNVERVPTNETASSSGIVGVDLVAQRETGRFLYDVFGNVEYQHFFEENVESQTYGQVRAGASYAIVPERFIWGLSGSFDQTRSDLLRPVTPGNLDDVLTFSTGPQWTVRFASALEGTLEGHYVVADYREQPFDSDTLGASAVFGRRPSTLSFIGLGASADQVTYDSDDPQAEDFDRTEVFLRFNAEGVRTTVELDAGYAEIDGETFKDDGPMFRLQATRKLTPVLQGFADYRQEFPTSGGATFSPDSPPQLGTDASVLTGGPRKIEAAELGFRLRATRTEGLLSYLAREEAAIDNARRRDFEVLTASGTYFFAPRASITLFARFTDEEVSGVSSDEQQFGGRISVRLGRLTSINLRVEHRTRDSDNIDGNFAETSGGLFLRYGSPDGAQGWR